MGKQRKNKMQIDRSDKPDTAIKLSDNMQIEEIFLNQEETKEVKGGKNEQITSNIKQGNYNSRLLLHKVRKTKIKNLSFKAKKRQEKGVERALINMGKSETKINKNKRKLIKKKKVKTIWQ